MTGIHHEINSIRCYQDWPSHSPIPDWACGFLKSANASFSLPVQSEELYLEITGSRHYGDVIFKQGGKLGEVGVNVRVAHQSDRDLDHAGVYRVEQDGNRQGIKIITPSEDINDSTHTRNKICFLITLTFPASSGAPIRIRKLRIRSTNLNYRIEELAQKVRFGNLTFDVRDGSVQVGSISLAHGLITSTNGDIGGQFNASQNLTLQTGNGNIASTVSLSGTGGSTTKSRQTTRNGFVFSKLTLVGETGKFSVKGWSALGNVHLEYQSIPASAHIDSEAKTANGQATVDMHPGYEGRFEVKTKSIPCTFPSVEHNPEDPVQHVCFDTPSSENEMCGVVRQRRGGKHAKGSCIVHSDMGTASLNLRGPQDPSSFGVRILNDWLLYFFTWSMHR